MLIKLEFSRQIVEKSSNIKFHENPSSGCQIVSCGHKAEKTKLTVAFRNFANAPKNGSQLTVLQLYNKKAGLENIYKQTKH
jgi:hypothetical protein